MRGHLKDYAWGVVDGLRDWAGGPTGGPQAELWFGAHPSGPAVLRDAPGELPDAVGEVPLLVKLLAAASPLSIQLHPDAATAAAVLAAQQSGEAPALLSDDAEKTELLLAVQPFSVLAGWRDLTDAAALLHRVGVGEAAATLRAGQRAGAIRHLLALPAAQVAPAVAAIGDAAADLGWPAAAAEAMAAIASHYPQDPGVLVAATLQHETLQPGDAVFVPAGTPHAYVHGMGVEVMAASDNVLRLGLTPKTVAVEAALGALRHDRAPVVARGTAAGAWLEPAGAPFAVATAAGPVAVQAPAGSYRLVLAVHADAVVGVAGVTYLLRPGDALVVEAAEPLLSATSGGLAVVARSCPPVPTATVTP